MTKTTRELATIFADHLANGQFVEAFSMVGEDGRYTVIGTTPISRTYEGVRDIIDNLVPALAGFREAPVVTIRDVVVDGDRAVLIGSGTGKGPHGTYTQPHYAFAVAASDGRITEIVEYMDTVMLETAIFGRTLS